jgi:hypothetical protein
VRNSSEQGITEADFFSVFKKFKRINKNGGEGEKVSPPL